MAPPGPQRQDAGDGTCRRARVAAVRGKSKGNAGLRPDGSNKVPAAGQRYRRAPGVAAGLVTGHCAEPFKTRVEARHPGVPFPDPAHLQSGVLPVSSCTSAASSAWMRAKRRGPTSSGGPTRTLITSSRCQRKCKHPISSRSEEFGEVASGTRNGAGEQLVADRAATLCKQHQEVHLRAHQDCGNAAHPQAVQEVDRHDPPLSHRFILLTSTAGGCGPYQQIPFELQISGQEELSCVMHGLCPTKMTAGSCSMDAGVRRPSHSNDGPDGAQPVREPRAVGALRGRFHVRRHREWRESRSDGS